jgi:D-3-phosphoglycerate dehydrogenase
MLPARLPLASGKGMGVERNSMRIGFLSKVQVNIDCVRRELAPREIVIVRSREDLLARLPELEVLVVQNQGFAHGMLAADCLDTGKRLRLIQHHGVTPDTTDVEAAAARGIAVAAIPGQNSRSVAEHAFFLMLALARRARAGQRLLREGRMGEVECIEVEGKRLCIVGLGTFGKMLARMAQGFGMEVVAVRRNVGAGELLPPGVSDMLPTGELDRAFAGADVVVLALPLTRETFHLMNRGRFAALKPGALLVNVSRGDHVERTALEEALREGRLGGYATDGFWGEPADPADPLLADERILVTPHMGGKSAESMQRSARAVRENIERLERGEPLLGLVA